ncbi:MAG: efflux RND transporter periplasmic adaptor subunit, partial [Acidobacteriales bacterium]|nr:efflux RND transporter periplasmic adaptor subunit [Terriglobales bacterium]
VATTLYVSRLELKVAGDFTILPIHNVDVRAEVGGIIQEIRYDEGDIVNRGDVIARLADRDCAAELHKVKAEIEEKEAKLKMLRAGPRPEEVRLAQTTVAKTEQRAKFARQQWDRDKALFDQQLASKRDFEATEEQLALREKEYQEAKDQLKVLLAGSRAEDIEALEAEVRRLSAQQRYLEEQRRLHTVASPAAGVVTTRRLKETIGQYVGKGDLIAEVHEMQTVRAEIAVPEKEIGDVKAGQKVALKARAYPQLVFFGTVKSVAPVATKDEEWRNDRTVLVTTELDNSSGLLKSAMTGRAKIYCGEVRTLDLLTRRLARYIRVEFWSWW